MKYDDARRDDAGMLANMLGNDQTGVNYCPRGPRGQQKEVPEHPLFQ